MTLAPWHALDISTFWFSNRRALTNDVLHSMPRLHSRSTWCSAGPRHQRHIYSPEQGTNGCKMAHGCVRIVPEGFVPLWAVNWDSTSPGCSPTVFRMSTEAMLALMRSSYTTCPRLLEKSKQWIVETPPNLSLACPGIPA